MHAIRDSQLFRFVQKYPRMPMAGHRKRVQSFNRLGHAHELTFSCFHGLKLLDRDRMRCRFVDAWEATRAKHRVHRWACVIMREHVHVLF